MSPAERAVDRPPGREHPHLRQHEDHSGKRRMAPHRPTPCVPSLAAPLLVSLFLSWPAAEASLPGVPDPSLIRPDSADIGAALLLQTSSTTESEPPFPGSGPPSATVPGSRLRSPQVVLAARKRLLCQARHGSWVHRGEPRPLPWSVEGPYHCRERWLKAPGHLEGRDADRVTSAEQWQVREGLKYQWEVNTSACGAGTELAVFEPDVFCSLVDQLGGPILLVGDSLTKGMLDSLHNHLLMDRWELQSVGFTPEICLQWEDLGLEQKGGRPHCEGLNVCRFPIFRIRNDRLTLLEGNPEWGHSQFYLPWLDLVKMWGVKAVLLNRGAHFTETPKFTIELDAALKALRDGHPDLLLLYRSTPPGHRDCESYKVPLAAPQDPVGLPFNWDSFHEQNLRAKVLVEKYGGVFLDVESMSALRADGHHEQSWGHVDCLHYCNPGPVDTWVQLFQEALQVLV